jgi:hypothetical protein
MAASRINHIRGTDETFEIDIVDDNGQPFDPVKLIGAVVDFKLRTTPTAVSDLIHWTSAANPTKLFLTGNVISLVLASEDTEELDIAVYAFQIGITLHGSDILPPIIEWSPLDLNLGGEAHPEPPVFTNTVKVDHDYGATDALRYTTPGGSPIESAQIRVYYKSDYDAGRLNTPVGVSQTNAFGRWANPVLVLPGFSYSITFFKPNEFGPDKTEIVA